jgi:hypothetical protein
MIVLICISMLGLSFLQRAYASLLTALSVQNPHTEFLDFQENEPYYTDNESLSSFEQIAEDV